MRQSGELPSVLALDGHNVTVLMDKAAIDRLAHRHQPRERLVWGAWKLGLPTYAVRELIQRERGLV
jgi:hypothetical protein